MGELVGDGDERTEGGEWRRRQENLCDAEGAATFVSSGVALSEIYFGSGFLCTAWGHPAGKLGWVARAGGGESVGYGAGGAAVARSRGCGAAGDQCAAKRSGPQAVGICEVGEAGAGAVFQPPL